MDAVLHQIKALSAQHHIPVFGIAPSAHLENAPVHYRPSDLLPSPASVICLGIPVPRGTFLCKERANETYWRAANIYYRAMDAVLMQVARILEEKGDAAVPVCGCYPYDVKGPGDFWGYLSLVRMAEAVGIGTIARNGLLFNARYGPRLILGGIVTTATLPEMVWPNREHAGCPADCFVCQEQCPVGAIDRGGNVDRLLCVKHSMKSPIFSFLMRTKEFDISDAAMLNLVTAVDDHSMYTCTKCVAACPFL